jgi:hypothetical protein
MLDWSSPTDVVFGSEVVKTLKQHCKDVAINGQLCWRMEELLQWAHEGNKLYSKRYPGKLDYNPKGMRPLHCQFYLLGRRHQKF